MQNKTNNDIYNIKYFTISYKEGYEEYLKQRKKQHLNNIQNNNLNCMPCLHDNCPECMGTGIKKDGSMCIHNISCTCPKCSPKY